MSAGVRVLRVEHNRHRRGPYNAPDGRIPWPQELDYELRAARPLLTEEGVEWPSIEARFAFASFAQFRRWFPRYLRDTLDRNGYVLAVYEVDPAALLAVTPAQVCFDPAGARHVRDLYLVSKRHSSLEPAF